MGVCPVKISWRLIMGLWNLHCCTVIPNYNQGYINLNTNDKAERDILCSLLPTSVLTRISSQYDALTKLGLDNYWERDGGQSYIFAKRMVLVLNIWFLPWEPSTISIAVYHKSYAWHFCQQRFCLFLNPGIRFLYGKEESWDGSCFHFCFHY